MNVVVIRERGKVLLVKGNLRVTMTQAEFESRVCDMTDWYGAKKGTVEYDKYHGNASAMFDPESPFPKQFTHKVNVRWKPSGATNGPVIDSTNAFEHMMRRR
jgi:hypothetical protein